ncbi:MAG: hypothetical protein KAY44_04560 [Neisseria sp.]|jgi:hypothetical protein|nr:hypothetical protein [Neisseria sp.]
MMGFERYPLLKQKTLSVKVYDIVFTWLGSVHHSSASKILSAKAWLQGEKHSKVEHLASIFNAAGAFLSQNIAA